MNDKPRPKGPLTQYIQGGALSLAVTTALAVTPMHRHAVEVKPPRHEIGIKDRIANIRAQLNQQGDATMAQSGGEHRDAVVAQWDNWNNWRNS